MTRKLLLVCCCGLGLSSGAAWGQDPLEPPDLGQYLRWGPVRVRPTFAFSNLGYDDNIFYRTGTEPKQGDYTARLSPSVSGLTLFGHRAFLTFEEKLEYTMYAKFGSQSYLNQLGQARVTFPFQRMGVFVEGAFNQTKERPEDVQDVRADRREARLGAGVIFRIGWRSDVELGHVRTDWTHSDPDFGSIDSSFTIGQLLNRVDEGQRLRARYRVTGQTRLVLEASSKTSTFDDPSLNRDSRETRITPGIDFGQGGRLSGSLRAGWARLDSSSPLLSDFSGGVWDSRIAYRLSSGTTIQAGGRRQVAFALYFGNQFYLNSTYELRAIHFVNRAIGLEAGASRGRLTFPDSTRRDRIGNYDVGVRLRLKENDMGRKIEYSLRYTWLRQDSTVDVLDQSRAVVGFGAVVGY
jgi:hypothetical protein